MFLVSLFCAIQTCLDIACTPSNLQLYAVRCEDPLYKCTCMNISAKKKHSERECFFNLARYFFILT